MPETLRQLMSQGSIDSRTSLDLLGQLLRALELTHWQEVVYGDIAPENILVSSSGRNSRARFADAPPGAASSSPSPARPS